MSYTATTASTTLPIILGTTEISIDGIIMPLVESNFEINLDYDIFENLNLRQQQFYKGSRFLFNATGLVYHISASWSLNNDIKSAINTTITGEATAGTFAIKPHSNITASFTCNFKNLQYEKIGAKGSSGQRIKIQFETQDLIEALPLATS